MLNFVAKLFYHCGQIRPAFEHARLENGVNLLRVQHRRSVVRFEDVDVPIVGFVDSFTREAAVDKKHDSQSSLYADLFDARDDLLVRDQDLPHGSFVGLRDGVVEPLHKGFYQRVVEGDFHVDVEILRTQRLPVFVEEPLEFVFGMEGRFDRGLQRPAGQLVKRLVGKQILVPQEGFGLRT